MNDLGYGSGYRYDHDWAGGVAPQRYLPDVLAGAQFYKPGQQGREAAIAERLVRIERMRTEAGQGGETSGAS